MQTHRIALLLAALVVPRLALAELPFPNDTFGRMEGTIDFCARVDSQSAAKYQEAKKGLVRDVPEREVIEARRTKKYNDAYEGITAGLDKAAKDQAIAACKAYLEGK